MDNKPESVQGQIQYVIDNYEVKASKQIAKDLGIGVATLYGWVSRMRANNIAVPKKTSSNIVVAAIDAIKNDPRNTEIFAKWNNR
jgi:transposase-like protein